MNSPNKVDFATVEIDTDLRILPVDLDGVEVKEDAYRDIRHTLIIICPQRITGRKGVERTFDLGGKIPPGDGPICMLASHDESCAKAGEYSNCPWAHKDNKEVCRDKSQGPSLHIASFSVEW